MPRPLSRQRTPRRAVVRPGTGELRGRNCKHLPRFSFPLCRRRLVVDAGRAAGRSLLPFVRPLKRVGHNEGANAALLDKHTDDDEDDGVDDRGGRGRVMYSLC